ncbi:hypothetical protein ABZS84_22765 [Streptomyces sp. NPDC005481]|uniref:hypothetical protein n=1 Tax=Streptomyces sp. NPDC005481 TaxID=3154881 RepID=UPI0033B618FE
MEGVLADGVDHRYGAPEGPESPQWIRSDELDRDGSGHSTNLWFDRRSHTVRFWALNPYG